MNRITAIVTARHKNGESITHDCKDGYVWEDPTDGYLRMKDFASEHAYKNGVAELKRAAKAELLMLCAATDHCQCRRLIKPRATWADSVVIEVEKRVSD